jgi:hypothetical protein
MSNVYIYSSVNETILFKICLLLLLTDLLDQLVAKRVNNKNSQVAGESSERLEGTFSLTSSINKLIS